jgi:predicted TIM-barrel fold metal-dependent hydrolase
MMERVRWTRRAFLGSLQAELAGQVGGGGLELARTPNYCSHEHWGSIDSIGRAPEGYRADMEAGAKPRERTGILDLLADPYFSGWMARAGGQPDRAMARREPWRAYSELQPALERQRFSGIYQCLRRGLLALHGVDITGMTKERFETLEGRIGERYGRVFEWYREAMRRAHFSELVRIVHPEFYWTARTAAAREELSFTRTILRIDPFLDLWRTDSARRARLAGMAGVEPGDARSWRAFLAAVIERARDGGALGIKQLQAYRRTLRFEPRMDGEVRFRGELSAQEVTAFEDWVVHECSKLAEAYGWPQQVHVGTNNIEQSSPMPLAALASRYPRMKIVMIHCWPFLREAGWLAKFHANVFIDTCWMPVLNPEFFREALTMWWNYVPQHKITCGHDATSVEMAAGSSLFTREILAGVIEARSGASGYGRENLERAGLDLLHNNAVAIYGAGEAQSVRR